MNKPKIIFVYDESSVVKKRHTDGGWDLPLKNDIVINPNEIKVVETGIRVQIPENFVGLIRERSSQQLNGIKVLGGVIDSEYRGEIKLVLANLSNQQLQYKKGDKLQQLLIVPVLLNAEIKHISEIDENFYNTSRGENGFGSTGI